MKDNRFIETQLKLHPMWFCGISSFILMSCANIAEQPDIEALDGSAISQNVSYANEINEKSSINVNQIGSQTSTLTAPQIEPTLDANKLSVDQLKAYADRCAPNAVSPPPSGLDCSELNLRIDRMLNSDDLVNDALVTLDRLGRNNTIDENLEGLKNGRPGSSINSQAIAGGILDPVTPLPTEIENDSIDFLRENGFNIDAGAIISTQR